MTYSLLSVGLVLVVALITSLLSKRIKVPIVVLEIVIGILLGNSWLGILGEDVYLNFFSNLGLIFLLFLAGLEMGIKMFKRESLLIALASFGTPFIIGMILGRIYEISPLLIGVLLSTTSVGVVLSVVRELELTEEIRDIILESSLMVDALSMFALTVSLEAEKGTSCSSILLSSLSALALFAIPVLVRGTRIKKYLSKWLATESHFKHEVRFCLALTVIIAGLFEILGFHAILGSFLAGLIISEVTEEGDALREKLLGLGYGFFIPFFFVIAGAVVNIPLLAEGGKISLIPALLIAGLGGKILGVGITSKLLGIPSNTSLGIGTLHSARLSLIIAGAKLGLDLGLLTQPIYSAIVIFSLTTVIISPMIAKAIMR